MKILHGLTIEQKNKLSLAVKISQYTDTIRKAHTILCINEKLNKDLFFNIPLKEHKASEGYTPKTGYTIPRLPNKRYAISFNR